MTIFFQIFLRLLVYNIIIDTIETRINVRIDPKGFPRKYYYDDLSPLVQMAAWIRLSTVVQWWRWWRALFNANTLQSTPYSLHFTSNSYHAFMFYTFRISPFKQTNFHFHEKESGMIRGWLVTFRFLCRQASDLSFSNHPSIWTTVMFIVCVGEEKDTERCFRQCKRSHNVWNIWRIFEDIFENLVLMILFILRSAYSRSSWIYHGDNYSVNRQNSRKLQIRITTVDSILSLSCWKSNRDNETSRYVEEFFLKIMFLYMIIFHDGSLWKTRKLFFLFDESPFEDVTDPVVSNLSDTCGSRSKDYEQDTTPRRFKARSSRGTHENDRD